ncbi:MAG: Tol-Pal system beta propeller repeat protein TolB [Alphaproteobacteria bacterium]
MRKIITILFFCLTFFLSAGVKAELTIDVSGAMREPMPIAMPEIVADGFWNSQYAEKIRKVVIADLERSGLFEVIPDRSYIEDISSVNQEPIFNDWKAINAQALVQMELFRVSETELKVEMRLWDVFGAYQLKGQAFSTTTDNWRRIAHVIADSIYERLTGEKGYFDTRIVYISESGSATKKVKRLAIMDQDGENHKYLTDGANLVLTPRFSPNMQLITYMSYIGGNPRVYTLDLQTGEQTLLGNFPGMTFAPRFSPDSSSVLLSYASNGKSDIYEMMLKDKSIKQLTKNSSIDTSPSYSPDGKQIVFNSDRGGDQQLYIMNADGSDVKRISFGSGRYATPVWSPRGDYIAFTKMSGGQFYIGVMYPDGSGERLLASGFLVEGPTWSPNGRVLIFFRQERGSKRKSGAVKLYSIDLTGYNERLVLTPSEASDPAWSPLLP